MRCRDIIYEVWRNYTNKETLLVPHYAGNYEDKRTRVPK